LNVQIDSERADVLAILVLLSKVMLPFIRLTLCPSAKFFGKTVIFVTQRVKKNNSPRITNYYFFPSKRLKVLFIFFLHHPCWIYFYVIIFVDLVNEKFQHIYFLTSYCFCVGYFFVLTIDKLLLDSLSVFKGFSFSWLIWIF
jgi:hypothetical protein